MPRLFRNNSSQTGNSNISTVFEIALITTYFLSRIECSNALSVSKFGPQHNSLASTTIEKKFTGSAAPNLSSTSLYFQFSGTMHSLEETLVAFSPKEISNTLRPFEGWYNEWDATGNPSCYPDWEEGEEEDTLKSPTYSWSAYSSDSSNLEDTGKKNSNYRSISTSSSKLFSKDKANTVSKDEDDDFSTAPQGITRILMKFLILLTAGAKIVTSV